MPPLAGLALGGLLGAREGLVRPLGVQSPTFRLRLNAVLNQVTRRGSFFGNSAGVVALIYNIADASIDAARGKHDLLGSVAAGGISGAVFKCTGELRFVEAWEEEMTEERRDREGGERVVESSTLRLVEASCS